MGELTAVDDQSFEQVVLQSKVPVVVDFWASWCGPCKAIAGTLEGLANEFDGRIRVVKVDVDQAPGTANKYRISGLPTVAIFAQGQRASSLHGVQTASRYRQEIRGVLDAASSSVAVDEDADVFSAIAGKEPALLKAILAAYPGQLGLRNEHGESPLTAALLTMDESLVAPIVAATPEMNLHELAATGQTEALEAAIESSPAGLDEPNSRGYTALHLAAAWNQRPCADMLLKHGARLDTVAEAEDFSSQSPAVAAIQHEKPDVLRSLLDRGLDPNASVDEAVGSLLHVAALLKREEAYALLVQSGADESLTNAEGLNPREAADARARAFANLNDPLVQLLKNAVDDADELDKYLAEHPYRVDEKILLPPGIFTPLRIAFYDRGDAAIRAILKHQPTLGAIDLAGLNRTAELSELVRDDKEVALRQEGNMTPAVAAAIRNSVESLDVLLKAGQDPSDQRLIDHVLKYSDAGVMRSLVRHGLDLQDAETFSTMLRNASAQYNQSLVDYLLEFGAQASHTIGIDFVEYALEHATPEIASSIERYVAA